MPSAIVKNLNPLELGSASTLNPVQLLVAVLSFTPPYFCCNQAYGFLHLFLSTHLVVRTNLGLLVLRVFYSAPSCRYPCLLFDSNVILLTNPVVSSDFRLFHVTQIQKVTRWNTRGKP